VQIIGRCSLLGTHPKNLQHSSLSASDCRSASTAICDMPLLSILQVPVVAAEPRVKFLRGLPKVGGYCAVAVPAGPSGPSAGTFQAVLAADSLLPEGSGAALSAGDVTVLWDIAQALGKALDAAAAVKRWARLVLVIQWHGMHALQFYALWSGHRCQTFVFWVTGCSSMARCGGYLMSC
jgi:hypothetical protein